MPDDDKPPLPGAGPQLRPATRRRPQPVEEPDPERAAAPPAPARPPVSLAERLAALQAEPREPQTAARKKLPARKPAKKAPKKSATAAEPSAAGKAAATKAPVKKGPVATAPSAKKAPTTRALAKKAVAKKAVATKAAAKKAPAKKAAATTVAKKAPAKKAAASATAPAVRAAVAAAVPSATPAAPVRKLPPPPPPPPPTPAAVATPATTADVSPGAVIPPVRRNPAWIGLLLALTGLFLVVAAGLAAAALVASGTETWSSSAAVRFLPAAGGQPGPAVQKYRAIVPTLTASASDVARVPRAAVRDDLSAERLGSDQLRVTAHAATADEAERLAAAGVERVVARVAEDEQSSVALPTDRLQAVVSDSVDVAARTKPSRAVELAAGLLAGGAVLLLLLLVALRRRRSAR